MKFMKNPKQKLLIIVLSLLVVILCLLFAINYFYVKNMQDQYDLRLHRQEYSKLIKQASIKLNRKGQYHEVN